MDELFQTPPTPIPPLEAARRRLARAIEREHEAEGLLESHGPEAQPAVDYSRAARGIAEAEVARLEKEALK